jgi:hypothetical protein
MEAMISSGVGILGNEQKTKAFYRTTQSEKKVIYTDVRSIAFFHIFFLTSFTNNLKLVIPPLPKVGVNKLLTDGECYTRNNSVQSKDVIQVPSAPTTELCITFSSTKISKFC